MISAIEASGSAHMASKAFFANLLLKVPSADFAYQRGEARGGNRAVGEFHAFFVQRGGEFAVHPVGSQLALSAGFAASSK